MNFNSDPFAALSRPSAGRGRGATGQLPSSGLNPFAPPFRAAEQTERGGREPGNSRPSWAGSGPFGGGGALSGSVSRSASSWGNSMSSPSADDVGMESSEGDVAFGGQGGDMSTSPNGRVDRSSLQNSVRAAPSIQCRVCKRSFPSFPELKQHIRDESHYDTSRLPATRDTPTSDGSRSFINTGEGRTSQSFSCRVCRASFPSFLEMKQHIKAENHFAPLTVNASQAEVSSTNDAPEAMQDESNQGNLCSIPHYL